MIRDVRPKKNSKRKFIFCLFGVFITLFIILFIFLSPFLKLQDLDLEIIDAKCVDKDKIRALIGVGDTYTMFLGGLSLEDKVKKNFFCVKKIHWEFTSLNRIKVVIEGRIPRIQITTGNFSGINLKDVEATPSSQAAFLNWSLPSFDKFWLADETGLIFEEGTKELSVIVLPEQKIAVGFKLDKWFKDAVTIFDSLINQNNLAINRPIKARLDGDNLLITGSLRIAFSLKKDVLRQLASLQLILLKAKIDEGQIEMIDLRFDKPVVVYLPKTK